MERFPIVNINQIVLVRADFQTGQILDEDFELATKNTQVVYSIFESLSHAKTYAIEITKERNVECILYNSEKKVIDYITPSKE